MTNDEYLKLLEDNPQVDGDLMKTALLRLPAVNHYLSTADTVNINRGGIIIAVPWDKNIYAIEPQTDVECRLVNFAFEQLRKRYLKK